MEVRRFTLTVPDERGYPQRGEVLLVERWQPELAEKGPEEGSSFRIVVLSQPAPPSAHVAKAAVAVVTPSRPIERVTAVHEPPPAIYAVRKQRIASEAPFPSLSVEDMASYAEGRILTAAAPPVAIGRVFPPTEGTPRLELLARALLSVPEERGEALASDRFLGALASALRAPAVEGEAPDAEKALVGLRKLQHQAQAKLRDVPSAETSPITPVVEGLRAIAEAKSCEEALGEARHVFGEPLAFAEAVFLCRSLARDPEPALELAEMRAYLETAVVPESAGELALDRRVTLEQLSAAALFMEPHRFDGMRATFEYFRKRFAAAYREHHQRYWQECARALRELEDAEATARALIRLNSVKELGNAVGLNALARYNDLRRELAACALDEALSESLLKTPQCPMCAVTLADEPPHQAVRDVVRRLTRALGQQQIRLSSAAIRQILASQKGERIEQFLQVVQASDLRGLANVLDDDLVAFLRALLGAPRRTESALLASLRKAHPEVSEASLEATVETFRRLLTEELAAQRQSNPLRPPRVVLDPQAISKTRE